MDSMDKSLDDIISAQKKKKNLQNGGVRKQGAMRGRNRQNQNRRNMPGRNVQNQNRARSTNTLTPTTKLELKNLNYSVTDQDIKDLFSEFGEVISASIHYDPNGKSIGQGHVVYTDRNSAALALAKYNNVLLDGRNMRIRYAGVQSNQNRGAIKRLGQGRNLNKNKGLRQGDKQQQQQGGKRQGRGPKKNPEKVPTAEELDAELDAYTKAAAAKE